MSDTTSRFNEVAWHDSRLLGFKLISDSIDQSANLNIDLELLTNPVVGAQEWENRTLVLIGCRSVAIDLDLLGLRLVGGDISDALCDTGESVKERFAQKLEEFDLPQSENPLDGLFLFRIVLIHPAGELNVLAKDFEWA